MQLFEEGYGIPAHSYGTGTDSCVLDAQNFIERTSLIQAMALSGASIIGGAGQLEVAKTISPIQLIIDNDTFLMIKKLRQGFEINDDLFGYEELMDIKDGESFITTQHTLKYFRDTLRPEVFNRDTKAVWENKGSRDTTALANEVLERFRKEYLPVKVPDKILTAMDEVVQAADNTLAKNTRRW